MLAGAHAAGEEEPAAAAAEEPMEKQSFVATQLRRSREFRRQHFPDEGAALDQERQAESSSSNDFAPPKSAPRLRMENAALRVLLQLYTRPVKSNSAAAAWEPFKSLVESG